MFNVEICVWMGQWSGNDGGKFSLSSTILCCLTSLTMIDSSDRYLMDWCPNELQSGETDSSSWKFKSFPSMTNWTTPCCITWRLNPAILLPVFFWIYSHIPFISPAMWHHKWRHRTMTSLPRCSGVMETVSLTETKKSHWLPPYDFHLSSVMSGGPRALCLSGCTVLVICLMLAGSGPAEWCAEKIHAHPDQHDFYSTIYCEKRWDVEKLLTNMQKLSII